MHIANPEVSLRVRRLRATQLPPRRPHFCARPEASLIAPFVRVFRAATLAMNSPSMRAKMRMRTRTRMRMRTPAPSRTQTQQTPA